MQIISVNCNSIIKRLIIENEVNIGTDVLLRIEIEVIIDCDEFYLTLQVILSNVVNKLFSIVRDMSETIYS